MDYVSFVEKLNEKKEQAVITDQRFVVEFNRVTTEYLFYCFNLKEHIWIPEDRANGAVLLQIYAYKRAQTERKVYYCSEFQQSEMLKLVLAKDMENTLTNNSIEECRDNEQQQSPAF